MCFPRTISLTRFHSTCSLVPVGCPYRRRGQGNCCRCCRGLLILSISNVGVAFVLVNYSLFVFFILLGFQGNLNRPIRTTWEKVVCPGILWIVPSTLEHWQLRGWAGSGMGTLYSPFTVLYTIICDPLGCTAIGCKRASHFLWIFFPGASRVLCAVSCVLRASPTQTPIAEADETTACAYQGPTNLERTRRWLRPAAQATGELRTKGNEKPRAATARQVVSER